MGKGPPGPDPTTNRRARQGHPRCRSNRSAQAAHPMGSLPMGEASACASLLLPPSAQPVTGPFRLVAFVSELSVRVKWPGERRWQPRHADCATSPSSCQGVSSESRVAGSCRHGAHTVSRAHGPYVRARKGSQLLPGPGSCWTRLNSGVAPDRRPGRGVAGGKSRRPAARPFSFRPTRKLGQSGCRMRPVPFFLGPGGRPGWGTPCQVARPAQQPSRPVVPGEAIRVRP